MKRGPKPSLDHKKLHAEMLALQEQIQPFTPTIRELANAWGYRSTSTVRFTLDQLVEKGFVITRELNSKTSYYALPKPIPPYLAILMDQVGNVSR